MVIVSWYCKYQVCLGMVKMEQCENVTENLSYSLPPGGDQVVFASVLQHFCHSSVNDFCRSSGPLLEQRTVHFS